MVYGLLLTLKIIGMILLCILGCLLILISFVLLIPVRYCAMIKKQESFVGKSKISWLLHIVTATIVYEKQIIIVVKIFGIPIYKSNKNREKVEKEVVNTVMKTQEELITETEKTLNKDIPLLNDTIKKKDLIQSEDEESNLETDDSQHTDNGDTNKEFNPEILEDTKNDKQKETKKEFVLLRKIKQFYKKWKKNFTNLYHHILFCKENIVYYKEVWNHKCSEALRITIKKDLLTIWKMIKPKKWSFFIHVGMEDPYQTGQILAWYSIFYYMIGKNITIQPDYQEEVLEFKGNLQGKIRIIVLVKIAIKLFFDKNLKQFMELVKKEKK